MRKYKLREYFHYNKELDIEYYGYNKVDTDEMISDIDNELFRVSTLLDLGLCDEANEVVERLRECL